MLLHGAIIFGDLIEGRCNAYFHRANLRSAKLAFFRHCQVRIICRLDLILVLSIAFRKLLNDLIDLGSRKSDGRSSFRHRGHLRPRCAVGHLHTAISAGGQRVRTTTTMNMIAGQ